MSICTGSWKQNPSFSSEQNDGAMSERLYEIIMERQSHRLDDQRSELGGRPKSCSDLPELPHDMSELVITMSSRRLEDQRASLNPLKLSDSNLNSTGDNPPVRCASASATIN
uniref:G protein gamma domain-containing protein n=1 Tax=Bursaphelenchus xylophilus TaxID=6326 RepID=A0A1I7RPY9_BURXY